MKRIAILSVLLLVTACSEDGPLVPLDPARPMDLMVRDFAAALEAGDVGAVEGLLDPDPENFVFYFSPWDEDDHDLTTWYMNRGEFLQAWRNIFSGLPLKREDGTEEPAVTRIEVTRLVVDIPWAPPSPDHWSSWRIRMGIWEATYHFEMVVHRDGLPPLTIGNKIMFLARPLCGTAEDCWDHSLIGFDDFTGTFEPSSSTTFGTLLLDGFLNTPPEFEVGLQQLHPGSARVAIDACGIVDEGLPLERGEVRFRRVPDAEWTPWTEDCTATAIFEGYGEHQVEVQARDRWGMVSSRLATIDLLPPPAR